MEIRSAMFGRREGGTGCADIVFVIVDDFAERGLGMISFFFLLSVVLPCLSKTESLCCDVRKRNMINSSAAAAVAAGEEFVGVDTRNRTSQISLRTCVDS
mmetsp:Transcript_8429/g.11081  ORF Transcript_8429/g.11081 Transcript_8429/m.11081 type:complete len:100 (-) Transcript_8429:91-390(-)